MPSFHDDMIADAWREYQDAIAPFADLYAQQTRQARMEYLRTGDDTILRSVLAPALAAFNHSAAPHAAAFDAVAERAHALYVRSKGGEA